MRGRWGAIGFSSVLILAFFDSNALTGEVGSWRVWQSLELEVCRFVVFLERECTEA